MQKLEDDFKAAGGEWREVEIGAIFKIYSPKKRFDANKVKFGGMYPYVARGDKNNGIKGYITEDPAYLSPAGSISFGQDTATMFYQEVAYFTGDKIKIFEIRKGTLDRRIAQFMISAIRKSFRNFSWGSSSFNEDVLKKTTAQLPYLQNELAFSYMEAYIQALEIERIQALEAYLTVTGLREHQLTDDDQKVIESFGTLTNSGGGGGNVSQFKMCQLFNHIKQGRRLKKDDQFPGDLPFVMAGTTDTGLVGKIGNTVEVFPAHSLTIDIFGNTFYRSYRFGAGDDTGVFWNEEMTDRHALLFLSTVIAKGLCGKYDYGFKLRASQTHEMSFNLPALSSTEPDYAFMSDFIRAVEKLVIGDVVGWLDKRLEATKEVVAKQGQGTGFSKD